jgi:hypothetical protein
VEYDDTNRAVWLKKPTTELRAHVMTAFKAQYDPVRWPICNEKRVDDFLKAGIESLLPKPREVLTEQQQLELQEAQEAQDAVNEAAEMEAQRRERQIAFKQQVTKQKREAKVEVGSLLIQRKKWFDGEHVKNEVVLDDENEEVGKLYVEVVEAMDKIADDTTECPKCNEMNCLLFAAKIDLIGYGEGFEWDWVNTINEEKAKDADVHFGPDTETQNNNMTQPPKRQVNGDYANDQAVASKARKEVQRYITDKLKKVKTLGSAVATHMMEYFNSHAASAIAFSEEEERTNPIKKRFRPSDYAGEGAPPATPPAIPPAIPSVPPHTSPDTGSGGDSGGDSERTANLFRRLEAAVKEIENCSYELDGVTGKVDRSQARFFCAFSDPRDVNIDAHFHPPVHRDDVVTSTFTAYMERMFTSFFRCKHVNIVHKRIKQDNTIHS